MFSGPTPRHWAIDWEALPWGRLFLPVSVSQLLVHFKNNLIWFINDIIRNQAVLQKHLECRSWGLGNRYSIHTPSWKWVTTSLLLRGAGGGEGVTSLNTGTQCCLYKQGIWRKAFGGKLRANLLLTDTFPKNCCGSLDKMSSETEPHSLRPLIFQRYQSHSVRKRIFFNKWNNWCSYRKGD